MATEKNVVLYMTRDYTLKFKGKNGAAPRTVKLTKGRNVVPESVAAHPFAQAFASGEALPEARDGEALAIAHARIAELEAALIESQAALDAKSADMDALVASLDPAKTAKPKK